MTDEFRTTSVGSSRPCKMATLVDGYKRPELEGTTGLGLFRLSSIPVDRPEPSESLRVNIAWSVGLDAEARLLSTVQLDAFCRGGITQETDIHGRRGAYFLKASLTLPAQGEKEWKKEEQQNLIGEENTTRHLQHSLCRAPHGVGRRCVGTIQNLKSKI